MKLTAPPGLAEIVWNDGTEYTVDNNGQVDIGNQPIQPFLDAGFTIAQSVVTTANRPSVPPGTMIFDSTLGKPVWRNAANTGWVDATGTTA